MSWLSKLHEQPVRSIREGEVYFRPLCGIVGGPSSRPALGIPPTRNHIVDLPYASVTAWEGSTAGPTQCCYLAKVDCCKDGCAGKLRNGRPVSRIPAPIHVRYFSFQWKAVLGSGPRLAPYSEKGESELCSKLRSSVVCRTGKEPHFRVSIYVLEENDRSGAVVNTIRVEQDPLG